MVHNDEYDRESLGATAGALIYVGTSYIVVFQPHGSQQSPDIEIWSNCGIKLLSIECKAHETALQPTWNQHIIEQELLYLVNLGKYNRVFIRWGWQMLTPADAERAAEYYAAWRSMAKQSKLVQAQLNIALRFSLTQEQAKAVFNSDDRLTDVAIDCLTTGR